MQKDPLRTLFHSWPRQLQAPSRTGLRSQLPASRLRNWGVFKKKPNKTTKNETTAANQTLSKATRKRARSQAGVALCLSSFGEEQSTRYPELQPPVLCQPPSPHPPPGPPLAPSACAAAAPCGAPARRVTPSRRRQPQPIRGRCRDRRARERARARHFRRPGRGGEEGRE